MKRLDPRRLRLAQLRSWRDNLASNRSVYIPLGQLRDALGNDLVTNIQKRTKAMRDEFRSLSKQYPDLSGAAADYWSAAQGAFKATASARSDARRKAAGRLGEKAMELWESVPVPDQYLFHEPSPSDPWTGKAGIDQHEWSLPRLKSLSMDRPDLEHAEWTSQLEALDIAIGQLETKLCPSDQVADLLPTEFQSKSEIRAIIRKLRE
jgi:hypothetical protein